MRTWGRDHLMGGCSQILVTEAMSRASFTIQLYVEQQEMRNLLPVSRYSTDPKWKLRWNRWDKIFYSSNTGSAFDMVYQILQGGGKEKMNVGGLQKQTTNTLLMTKKKWIGIFLLHVFSKMPEDYLKYWIVEDHQTTLNLIELWKWTGKNYTD